MGLLLFMIALDFSMTARSTLDDYAGDSESHDSFLPRTPVLPRPALQNYAVKAQRGFLVLLFQFNFFENTRKSNQEIQNPKMTITIQK